MSTYFQSKQVQILIGKRLAPLSHPHNFICLFLLEEAGFRQFEQIVWPFLLHRFSISLVPLPPRRLPTYPTVPPNTTINRAANFEIEFMPPRIFFKLRDTTILLQLHFLFFADYRQKRFQYLHPLLTFSYKTCSYFHFRFYCLFSLYRHRSRTTNISFFKRIVYDHWPRAGNFDVELMRDTAKCDLICWIVDATFALQASCRNEHCSCNESGNQIQTKWKTQQSWDTLDKIEPCRNTVDKIKLCWQSFCYSSDERLTLMKKLS